MSSISARSAAVCFVLLCACIQMSFAQSPGYHMELSDRTSGQVTLVNDSAKTIEAFHFKGSCGPSGMSTSLDMVDGPETTRWPWRLAGVPEQLSVVAKPESRIFTGITLPNYPSGCVWDAKVDAVLYAGGGYEGDEAAAQRLMAHREGTIAAVKFWEEKFNQDGAEMPNADELLALAKKLKDAEFPQAFSARCSFTLTPECMRQRGKLEVDTFIANNMDRNLKAYGSERAEQQMVQSLGNWQKKIDKISLSQN